MTDIAPPMVFLPPNYGEIATYFPHNETYDVTEFVQGGQFIDVLRVLEKQFNFTTRLYKRKDGHWGVPYKLSNGTLVIPEGKVKDLVEGSVDLIVTGLAKLQTRLLVIDYLPILTEEYSAIFIPFDNGVEGLDWAVYHGLFSKELWFTIFITALVMTIFLYIMEWLKHKSVSKIYQRSSLFVDIFWANLMANFGGDPPESELTELNSYKVFTFTLLVCGFIIWSTYNAVLISQLSVKIVKLPFHDLDSLSKSNYRYIIFINYRE